MTNSNQKERFQTKIAMLEQNNQVLQNKCEEYLGELIRTRKKLDACVKALNKIANTDIKVIEKEPLYYARAMFSVTNNALARIQDIEQTKDKE